LSGETSFAHRVISGPSAGFHCACIDEQTINTTHITTQYLVLF